MKLDITMNDKTFEYDTECEVPFEDYVVEKALLNDTVIDDNATIEITEQNVYKETGLSEECISRILSSKEDINNKIKALKEIDTFDYHCYDEFVRFCYAFDVLQEKLSDALSLSQDENIYVYFSTLEDVCYDRFIDWNYTTNQKEREQYRDLWKYLDWERMHSDGYFGDTLDTYRLANYDYVVECT